MLVRLLSAVAIVSAIGCAGAGRREACPSRVLGVVDSARANVYWGQFRYVQATVADVRVECVDEQLSDNDTRGQEARSTFHITATVTGSLLENWVARADSCIDVDRANGDRSIFKTCLGPRRPNDTEFSRALRVFRRPVSGTVQFDALTANRVVLGSGTQQVRITPSLEPVDVSVDIGLDPNSARRVTEVRAGWVY